MAHRFQKGMMDYARGPLWLLRHRIAEMTTQTGAPPLQLLLHPPTLRQVIDAMAKELGVPTAEPGMEYRVQAGSFEGIPLRVCPCGKPMAADVIINCRNEPEEL